MFPNGDIQLEMDFFKRMGVYEKIPKHHAKGQKVISTRWVDTNKGDEANPDYRSRLVGRELNTGVRPDLFVATPPLEMLKVLMSYCAQNQDGGHPIRLATIDIKRAYFYAQARRDVYVKVPEEDFELRTDQRMFYPLQIAHHLTHGPDSPANVDQLPFQIVNLL